MDKLLIICGPTATGKTSLAIKLVKLFNGEIVSADSRQVYRYMNIGTGKDLPVNSKFETLNPKQITNSKLQTPNYRIGYYLADEVKIWLYDVVKPDYQFSVADYVKCANSVIKDIWERGKLPILVGGTGFYIKAVVEGIETLGIKPDWELREKLSKLTIEQLMEKLEELNPERLRGMNESDRNNPRRLIRAIEVAVWKLEVRSGKIDKEVGSEKEKISHFQLHNPASHFQHPTSTLFIGLKAPYKELYERIDKRVEERVKMGVEKEIRQLLEKGYTFENSALGRTIGYREWRSCFEEGGQKTESRKLVIQKWKFNEHGYARRQMTWFKTKNIHWFDIMEPGYQQKVARLVKEWYH